MAGGLSKNGTNNEDSPFQPMVRDSSQPLSHKDLSTSVYGPFYKIALGTAVVNQTSVKPRKPSRVASIIWKIVPIIVALPILYRTITLLGRLSDTYLLTKNWAIQLTLALFSVHGLVSLLVLSTLNSQNYFNEFIRRFALVLKNKSSPTLTFHKAHILMTIFMLFFLYTSIFFGVESVYDYEEYSAIPNNTAVFRNSVFGNQSVWPLDIIVQIWTTFMSATALVLYFLTNNALVGEYEKFNEELKEASKNGHLQHADLLTNYGARQMEFLEVIKYANDHMGLLISFTYMSALVIHLITSATMRGFGHELQPLEKTLVINFAVLSLLFLLIDIKRPAALHKQVQETKNILIFERSVWTQTEDKLFNAANNIISRIQNADWAALAFDGFRITEAFFHRTFLIFPVAIEVLAAFRKHRD